MKYLFSPTETTKEKILELLARMERSEDHFKRELKKKNLAGQFDPKNWSAYLLVLAEMTKYPPCQVCGGPVAHDRRFISSWLGRRTYICLLHSSHDLVYPTIAFMKAANPEKREIADEDLVHLVLGEKCKHDLYLLECWPCHDEYVKEKKRNANDYPIEFVSS